MDPEYTKPQPVMTDRNAPFWDATRQQELRVQCCDECGHLRYPVSEWCPECLATAHSWHLLTGRGTVLSYIVFHQVYDKAFAQDVPYNVALVELDEGPRMFSNVVGAPLDAVAVGDAVEVVFDVVTDALTIPRFRLMDGGKA